MRRGRVDFRKWVAAAAAMMEGAGVLTMVLGAVLSVLLGGKRVWAGERISALRELRQSLGRSILLGLELLVAADIIRTVSEIPSLQRVVVLALIVLIRTFLSFTLELEVEGSWPWQKRHAKDALAAKQSSGGAS